MLKRLLAEGNANDPLTGLLQLIRTRHGDRFRKRRIWVRLEQRQRRVSFRRIRPVLPALLFVSGAAAAELGYRCVVAPENASSPSGARLVDGPSLRLPACPDVVSKQHAAGEAATPGAETARSSERSLAHPVAAVAPEHAPLAASEDAEPVLQAIRALRVEGDPAHARRLLDAYLKAHPRGKLAADALALSIEAAAAQHDPRSVEYARRYLRAFPRGKYRDLATRAVAAR